MTYSRICPSRYLPGGAEHHRLKSITSELYRELTVAAGYNAIRRIANDGQYHRIRYDVRSVPHRQGEEIVATITSQPDGGEPKQATWRNWFHDFLFKEEEYIPC